MLASPTLPLVRQSAYLLPSLAQIELLHGLHPQVTFWLGNLGWRGALSACMEGAAGLLGAVGGPGGLAPQHVKPLRTRHVKAWPLLDACNADSGMPPGCSTLQEQLPALLRRFADAAANSLESTHYRWAHPPRGPV